MEMQELIDRYPSKTAFIFELDNVIFPAKDYDLQVYYLFGQFMEFTQPGIQEGKRIVDLRKQKGLSQRELALNCDWDKPNLRKLEHGRGNPTAKTLLSLCHGLGITIQEFFDFDN